MEILLASPLINDLILRGKIYELKDIMAKSNRLGMQTFDQALFILYESGTIAYDDAMRNADSRNELRLRIKLESERDSSEGDAAASEKLAIVGEEK